MSNSLRVTPVQTPDVDGVKVRRHQLDREAARMCAIAMRMGQRVQYWMRVNPVHEELPPWLLSTWREYNMACAMLLKEQRERAKMAPDKGGLALTDAEFEAKLKEIAQAALNEMTDDELAELIRARKVLK